MRSALVIFFSAFLILPIQNLSAQNYKLLWSDEFNESSLDAGIWTYETGNNKGWGNNEKEYYTNRPENLYLQNGVLVIQARKENYQGYEYTSARIKTQGKKFFQYGKIEARMKLPYGQGIWPAFWMLGENINSVSWPKCGEIDIMELIGGNKGGGGSGGDGTVFGTGHWFSQDAPNQHASYGSNYTLSSGRFADDFHIFAVTWDPKKIVWYIDDKPYVQLAITSSALSAFQKDFFIIFNLAVGGYWPGNPDSTTLFPQKMEVDYIRVYKDIGNFPSTSLIEPSDSSAFEANSNITLTASAETPSGSVSKVEFYQDALKIGETEVEPYQMTWGNVFPGTYSLFTKVYTSEGYSSSSAPVSVEVGGGSIRSPYSGSPWEIPGRIEAENFDMGGENQGYHDSDNSNNGGAYRPGEGVDIEDCSDTGGGYDIGWNQGGEWMTYTINVQKSGSYVAAVRVSSASGGGAFHLEIDGKDITGSISVPSTGNRQNWATVTSGATNIQQGAHILKFVTESPGFNFNRLDLYPPGSVNSVSLLSPNGGEVWKAGSIQEIKWNSLLVDQVKLGLSTDGGKNWSFISTGTTASFGVYRWLVPDINSGKCRVMVIDKDVLTVNDTSDADFSITNTTGIYKDDGNPHGFLLKQNYPNPFNPSTSISYSLPVDSFVSLKIFDSLGNLIGTLVNGENSAGSHSIIFDGKSFSSGIYYCRISAVPKSGYGSFVKVNKMILLK